MIPAASWFSWPRRGAEQRAPRHRAASGCASLAGPVVPTSSIPFAFSASFLFPFPELGLLSAREQARAEPKGGWAEKTQGGLGAQPGLCSCWARLTETLSHFQPNSFGPSGFYSLKQEYDYFLLDISISCSQIIWPCLTYFQLQFHFLWRLGMKSNQTISIPSRREQSGAIKINQRDESGFKLLHNSTLNLII